MSAALALLPDVQALVADVQRRAALVAFDAAAHRYMVDGVVRASVTQVIDGAGYRDTAFMKDRRSRGHAVHAYAVQYEAGILDLDTVPAELRGYVDSFAAAFDEIRPVTVLAEQLLYAPSIGVAGTLDRLWLVGGALEVTDFKAGVYQAWHKVQTAGYAYLLDPLVRFRRSSWLLKSNGRPAKRVPHEAYEYDTAAFLHAVGCHSWRVTHGV